MFLRFLRALSIGAIALAPLLSAPAGAQQIPNPSQAQQMMRTDPNLIGRLQQMMQQSGLTPDQVRDRLRTQGYPDSLLNQYLPGGRPDSTAGLPGDDVFAAVRALGLADSAAVDSLSNAVRSRRHVRAQFDSAFLDTLQRALRNDTTAAAIRSLLHSQELQRRQLDSGFKVFGLDIFSRDSGSFAPNTAGGADPNYRFGPDDRLVLILTGEVEKSYPLTVTREGFVVIPDVGTLNVAGMTRSQLEDALYKSLGRVYSGVRRGPDARTRFYINLNQMGTNQVFANGDVQHPASYRVPRAATVMSALYQAGGPTPSGSMRRVQVKRAGETVATFDVYDYALNGSAANDVRLENRDVVFVPPRGPQVRVAGVVLRPATYEVLANETVADVIRMAGGFSEAADTRNVQIERIVPPNERTAAGSDRRLIDVASDLFATTPVRGGDVIRVREIAKRVANQVKVNGNVWSPGQVSLTPGMTLYDALRRAGGLKPDSYLGQVLVSRLLPDSSREMRRTAVADTTGRPANNLVLADGDEITVYSLTNFRPDRYISINGAVRKPGRYLYRDGMTLHDAAVIAGGLREGASLQEAEIARLPENRAAGVTATTVKVPLDSTYLLDRALDGRYHGPPGIAASASGAPQEILRPYDAVLFKFQPEWQLQQTVYIGGEVLYPGPYSLRTKDERLLNIVERAGGLTATAYPDGITFIRQRSGIGRIGVDLSRVLRDSTYVDNLQLVDGDSIVIPRYAPVVTVRGAVYSQVGVAYVRGADIDYYIRSAGGSTIRGDGSRAYVTQPNGKVEAKLKHLFWTSEPKPQPGGTVTVPEKDPADKRDWAQVATAVTSILGSLVAIAALLRR